MQAAKEDRHMPCKKKNQTKIRHGASIRIRTGDTRQRMTMDGQKGKKEEETGSIVVPDSLYRPVNQLVQLRVVCLAARSAFSAITSNWPGIGLPVFAEAASKACLA